MRGHHRQRVQELVQRYAPRKVLAGRLPLPPERAKRGKPQIRTRRGNQKRVAVPEQQ